MFLDFDTKHVYWLCFGDKKCKNLVFGRSKFKFKCFWKNFKLIIMHFIHERNWFEWFQHKTSFVFQNFQFSRFSIDRMYFSTDRKCIYKFGLNLPALIVARLVLDQSNLFFDWSNPISTNQNSKVKSFKKLLPHMFFTISKAFQTFSLFFTSIDPI